MNVNPMPSSLGAMTATASSKGRYKRTTVAPLPPSFYPVKGHHAHELLEAFLCMLPGDAISTIAATYNLRLEDPARRKESSALASMSLVDKVAFILRNFTSTICDEKCPYEHFFATPGNFFTSALLKNYMDLWLWHDGINYSRDSWSDLVDTITQEWECHAASKCWVQNYFQFMRGRADELRAQLSHTWRKQDEGSWDDAAEAAADDYETGYDEEEEVHFSPEDEDYDHRFAAERERKPIRPEKVESTAAEAAAVTPVDPEGGHRAAGSIPEQQSTALKRTALKSPPGKGRRATRRRIFANPY